MNPQIILDAASADGYTDMAASMMIARLAEGNYVFLSEFKIKLVNSFTLDKDKDIKACMEHPDSFTYLIKMDNLFIAVLYQKSRSIVTATVFAQSLDELNNNLDIIRKELTSWCTISTTSEEEISLTFTWWAGSYATNTVRNLVVPVWDDIKQNYAPGIQPDLDALMKLDKNTIPEGRIILLHGPPGSGKSTLVRALIKEWTGWIEPTYVVDPDQLFSKPQYMISALLNEEGNTKKGFWDLFIIEDAEEFLVPDAKKTVGQALSRLLNFTDGMLGQGLKQLIVMTTNVEINELHPAIVRPGRCMVNIHVPAFTESEANKWLKAHDSLPAKKDSMTLAEMYEYINKSKKIEALTPKYDSKSHYI